ncbi:MAG: glycosyl hydrolase family 18 protein [Eisenbergiella sp.]
MDYVCLMTYDLKCGFHAPSDIMRRCILPRAMFSGTAAIRHCACLKRRFPEEKLLMGAAFYSRKWEDVPDRYHGFLQLTKTGGGYGPNYDKLADEYINKNGYVRYWDDEAKAPFLFNGSTFISYDDEESLAHKCAYVKREDIGGIFYWCHSGDTKGVLLRRIAKELEE